MIPNSPVMHLVETALAEELLNLLCIYLLLGIIKQTLDRPDEYDCKFFCFV